jgi:hypothetical protein
MLMSRKTTRRRFPARGGQHHPHCSSSRTSSRRVHAPVHPGCSEGPTGMTVVCIPSYCHVPLRTVDCFAWTSGKVSTIPEPAPASQHVCERQAVVHSGVVMQFVHCPADLHVQHSAATCLHACPIPGGRSCCTGGHSAMHTIYCRRAFAFPTSFSSAGLPAKSTAR